MQWEKCEDLLWIKCQTIWYTSLEVWAKYVQKNKSYYLGHRLGLWLEKLSSR